MRTNLELARECGMNAIRGGGWWFSDDDQLDDFAKRIRAEYRLQAIAEFGEAQADVTRKGPQ